MKRKMQTYRVTFANGLIFTTEARDREDAQEIAIEAFEHAGIVHDAIRSIVRVGA